MNTEPWSTNPRAAAIYCRISSDRDGEGLGVERQRKDCASLAARLDWPVVATFIDDDVSAYSKRVVRPQYQAMMSAIRRGEIDGVCVWALDRLYRIPRELEDLLDLAESGRVAFANCGGDIDLSTSQGRTMARVIVAFANQASADTVRRVSRKMADLAAAGHAHGGGTRPYGFEDDKVTLRESEVLIIRELVDAILNEGASLRSLCLRLNARGDLTTRGRPWRTTPLSRMLAGPRLSGWRTHTVKSNGITESPVRAEWPAIISDHERTLLIARLQTGKTGARDVHLLTGSVFCDICGSKMISWKSGPRRAYICPPKPQGNNCVSVAAESLERYVVAAATAIRHHERQIPLTLDTTAEYSHRAELVSAVRRGIFTASDVADSMAMLDAAIEAKAAANADAVVDAARTKVGDTLFSKWPTLNDEAKHLALSALVYRIDVRKATKLGRGFNAARVTVTLRADIADLPGDEPGDNKRAWADDYQATFKTRWRG